MDPAHRNARSAAEVPCVRDRLRGARDRNRNLAACRHLHPGGACCALRGVIRLCNRNASASLDRASIELSSKCDVGSVTMKTRARVSPILSRRELHARSPAAPQVRVYPNFLLCSGLEQGISRKGIAAGKVAA
jgi:hypothetical protein